MALRRGRGQEDVESQATHDAAANIVRLRAPNSRKRQPTPEEREAIIQSVITSQAFEGLEISYEEASRLFDKVWSEPTIEIE